MEDYMYQKYLYLSLGAKTKQLGTMKDEEWEVLERKELGTIRLFLVSSMFRRLVHATNIDALISLLSWTKRVSP